MTALTRASEGVCAERGLRCCCCRHQAASVLCAAPPTFRPTSAKLQVNRDFGSIFSTLLPGTEAKLEPPEGGTFLDGGCCLHTAWLNAICEQLLCLLVRSRPSLEVRVALFGWFGLPDPLTPLSSCLILSPPQAWRCAWRLAACGRSR